MALVIRNQQPGDGDELARVWESAGRYYAELAPELFQVPVSEGPAFERAIVPQDAVHLVAEADGVVAGWLTARLERPVPAPERQLVRALLSAAETWGRERGADLVQLDTYADGPVAVPFYEQRMGYRRRAIIFEKRL